MQDALTAMLFNYGLITSGILGLILASGLFVFLSQKWLGRFGAFIFTLDALALTAIGALPENVEPQRLYASIALFLFFPVAMLTISAVFFLMKRVKLRAFTFLVAVFAATVWAIHWTVGFGSADVIPEALSALSVSAWSIVLGFKTLKTASQSNK